MIMHWPKGLPRNVIWKSGVSLVDQRPSLLSDKFGDHVIFTATIRQWKLRDEASNSPPGCAHCLKCTARGLLVAGLEDEGGRVRVNRLGARLLTSVG